MQLEKETQEREREARQRELEQAQQREREAEQEGLEQARQRELDEAARKKEAFENWVRPLRQYRELQRLMRGGPTIDCTTIGSHTTCREY
ncbi:MAG: hypothetical protein ACE5IQ_13210 [Candidatus Methylomirabilales bacterium]